MATVVVLNGVSSAGKSSIARAIQQQGRCDFVRVALDDFIAMVPIGREAAPEWFVIRAYSDGATQKVSYTNGPRGGALLAAMRKFVGVIADQGIDVVVDDVFTADEARDYRTILSRHRLLVVKVDADIQQVAEREKNRGDRLIGLASDQAERIHAGIDYDLTVLNNDGQVEACARQILDALE